MNICECLTIASNLYPDKIAILHHGEQISYAELNRRSIAAADALSSSGVQPGDRVGIMLPNAPSFPVWYYGALRIGAVAVSVSTRLTASEVEFVTADCGAKVLVASQDAMQQVAGSLPDCVATKIVVEDNGTPVGDVEWSNDADVSNVWFDAEPDTAALILYTSGTTGFPKGATLSHGNVRSNVHAFNHLCEMKAEDRVLLAVPLFHCFGQNALLNSVFNVAGTLVFQQKFDLNESKRLIAEHQVTQLYGVPMMFQLLLESCQPEDLASVDYCFSAAATLPIQTSRAWQQKFQQPIYEGYGLTETSPFASYNHRIKFSAGTIGMPIDSVEMKIVDTETGADCETGQLGEIAIRGPNVMLGYWGRPEDTADAIRNGWFHSGDIGRCDEAGYFYIVDRVKDMITVGGMKTFPAEVERVLLDHDVVQQAAVVGIADALFGEQVIAFVVVDPDHRGDVEQLQNTLVAFAQQHLANYKVPREFIIVSELPRNPSGKVLKTQLREQAAEKMRAGSGAGSNAVSKVNGAAGGQANVSSPLARKLQSAHASERQRVATIHVQELVQSIGGLDDLPDPEASFIDAGLDSLMIVELTSQLQKEVVPQVELPATLIFDYPRLVDLANFVIETFHKIAENGSDRKDASHLAGNTSRRRKVNRVELVKQIENMSEADALAELMQELD